MKRLLLRSRFFKSFGFTLIELLVVMSIIAILAGVLFPVVNSAINAAKRAKANATISQIQTAVLAYNTEYSVYPVATGTGTDTIYSDSDGTDWAILDEVLAGNVRPSTGASFTPSTGPTNTRAIPFLNLKSSDVFGASSTGTQDAPKNPIPASNGTSLYFNIAMDSDYDGLIPTTTGSTSVSWTMPNFGTSTAGNITTGGTSSAGVALWVNCTGTVSNSTSTANNPSFWEKTY